MITRENKIDLAMSAAIIVGLAAAAAVGVIILRPPSLLPWDEFSVERAMAHVTAMTQAPHPMGSPEHARVREYLVKELEAMGLAAAIQQELAFEEGRDGQIRTARVHNVLARLPGSSPGNALLFVAHYDSVPTGPGAGDDAAGVAALLETLRLLRGDPRMKNDMIFLFSDGEERGLFGARAFMKKHPWAANVRLAANFEGRGSSGPSILFEVGLRSRVFSRRLGGAARNLIAYSFSRDVYRVLRYDTDFSVFRDAGLPGFNFAFIETFPSYHSELDTAKRLDPRSLLHHGTHALAIARRFGDANLDPAEGGGEAVYFTLPVVGLVSYPTGWSLLFAAVLLLAAAFVSVRAFREARLQAGRCARALLAIPAVLVAATAIVFLVNGAIELSGVTQPMLGEGELPFAGSFFLALAIAAAGLQFFGARLGTRHLAWAGAIAWSTLGVATAALLPSSSYLFIWPAFGSLAAFAIGSRNTGRGWLIACALPAMLIWSPSIVLIAIALGPGLASVVGLLTALVAVSLVEQLSVVTGAAGRKFPAAAAAIGLGLLIAAALHAGYDPDRPKANSLIYAVDDDAKEAFWLSYDRAPDAWTSQFLTETPERKAMENYFSGNMALTAKAPAVALPPPNVELVSDTSEGGGRRVTIRATSRRGAPIMGIRVRSTSQLGWRALRASEPAEAFAESETARDRWTFTHHDLSETGITLELVARDRAPIEIVITDEQYGFPSTPELSMPPRPAHMIPARFAPTDKSVVKIARTF